MLFILLIIFDQVVKYLIRWGGGFYICNSGISFGIIIPPFLFWLLWTSLILGLMTYCYFYRKKLSRTNLLGLIFILSGAVSNALDRFFWGCVLDFIDLKILTIFNLADVFIFFGAIIILATTVKNKH